MTDDPAFTEWWRRIRPHLGGAVHEARALLAATEATAGLEYEAHRKARRGWAEHDGGIRYMNPQQVEAEVRAELLDLLVYLAHTRASRG